MKPFASTILSFLLVAAIIGYITAWLYYKSIYHENLTAAESDKHELNNRIVNLDAEIFNLKESLDIKDAEIKHLTLEVKALKALQAEAVKETDDITLKNKRTEQLLYEKDEALIHIENDQRDRSLYRGETSCP